MTYALPRLGTLYSLRDARTRAVLATQPLAYWRLAEGSGLFIRDSAPGAKYPGVYTGVTWDGTQSPYRKPAPGLDGANDYGDVYSAAFASAFNMDEGAILLFLKVANAGVWTDGILRQLIRLFRNASNGIIIQKDTTNNQLRFQRTGNGINHFVTNNSFTATSFLSVMLSYTVAGNALKAYKNGAQIGATQTGLIAATGSGLNASATLLGALSQTPTNVWNGYLAEVVVWTKPADAAMVALGVPPA